MAMIQSSYVYQRHGLFYCSDLQLLVDQAPPSPLPAKTDSRNSQSTDAREIRNQEAVDNTSLTKLKVARGSCREIQTMA